MRSVPGWIVGILTVTVKQKLLAHLSACLAGATMICLSGGIQALGVVGGALIPVSYAPWSVSIHETFANEKTDCTGSIIDSMHVITAAHCLFDSDGVFVQPGHVTVLAGVSNYKHPGSTSREQVRTVSSVRVAPGFVWWTSGGMPQTDATHDIAVLTLANALDLGGPDVRSVALPVGTEHIRGGTALVLAGYGQESPSGADSGALEQMHSKTLAAIHCPLGALCAVSGTSDVCYGDSGAGLVRAGPHPVLVGVLSFGLTVCERGGVALYSDVGDSAVRRFVNGHSPSGAPPEPAATRWQPLGWRSYSASYNRSAIQLSVPKAWSLRPLGQSLMSLGSTRPPGLMTVTGVFGIGSMTKFFALARTDIPGPAQKLDPKARVRFRTVNLPGGISTLQITAVFTQRSGSISYHLWVTHYLSFHNGIGWDVEYETTQPAASSAIPVFEESARTIHFIASQR